MKSIIFAIIVVFTPLSIYAYIQGGTTTSYIDKYTITNGDKIVIFQGMSHIGLRSFYKEVGEEINEYRREGYIINFECFKTNSITLNKDEANYENELDSFNEFKAKKVETFKKYPVYSTTKYAYQHIELLRYTTYDDKCADMSELEINKLADRLSEKYEIAKTTNNKVLSNSYHNDAFVMLNKYERLYIYLANIRNQYIINFIREYQEKIFSYFDKSIILENKIIIEARNKHLADIILNDSNKLIYVNYGDGHFLGVFNLLKEKDRNWTLEKTTKKLILGNQD